MSCVQVFGRVSEENAPDPTEDIRTYEKSARRLLIWNPWASYPGRILFLGEIEVGRNL